MTPDKGNQEDALLETTNGYYCMQNHTGPLCQVCDNDNYYFSDYEEQCIKCPTPSSIVGVSVAIVIGLTAIIMGIGVIFEKKSRQLLHFVASLGLRAKFKLLITFYQILASFKEIYGIRLDSTFTEWMKYLTLNFEEIFSFAIPLTCVGNTNNYFILRGTWPYCSKDEVLLCISNTS